MNWQGWIFMILSWTVIIGLFVFCMKRTLHTDKNSDAPHNTENPATETPGHQQ